MRIGTNASDADIACAETVSSQRQDHCEAQERALMSKSGLSFALLTTVEHADVVGRNKAAQGLELSGGGSRQR